MLHPSGPHHPPSGSARSRSASPSHSPWSPVRRIRSCTVVRYAASRLAVDAGILALPKKVVFRAAKACFRQALRAIRGEAEEANAAFNQLVTATGDRELFPVAKAKTTFSLAMWRSILGLRLTLRGQLVIAIRTDRLTRVCRDKQTQRRLQQMLLKAQVLLPGHGGKNTRQPVTLEIDGKALRPRFWLLDAKRCPNLLWKRTVSSRIRRRVGRRRWRPAPL